MSHKKFLLNSAPNVTNLWHFIFSGRACSTFGAGKQKRLSLSQLPIPPRYNRPARSQSHEPDTGQSQYRPHHAPHLPGKTVWKSSPDVVLKCQCLLSTVISQFSSIWKQPPSDGCFMSTYFIRQCVAVLPPFFAPFCYSKSKVQGL